MPCPKSSTRKPRYGASCVGESARLTAIDPPATGCVDDLGLVDNRRVARKAKAKMHVARRSTLWHRCRQPSRNPVPQRLQQRKYAIDVPGRPFVVALEALGADFQIVFHCVFAEYLAISGANPRPEGARLAGTACPELVTRGF